MFNLLSHVLELISIKCANIRFFFYTTYILTQKKIVILQYQIKPNKNILF